MALREILARFGIQVDDRKLKQADKSVGSMLGKLRDLGGLLVGGVVARGLATFVKDMIEAGDTIGKTSTQLGLSASALQQWSFAADLAGVDAASFAASLRLLQKNSFEAERGSKSFVEAFDRLGVSVTNASGSLKSGDQIFQEVGLALNSLENSTERVALAQILMGRSGARLLPLFKDGEEGILAAKKAFDSFGGGLSGEFIPLAEDAKDRLTEFSFAMLSLKSRVGVALLPALSAIVSSLSKFIAAASKAVEGTNFMRAALAVFGAIGIKSIIGILRPFAPLLKALGLAAAKFLIVTLLVDDLITFFRGGKSVIGLFLDKLFGKGKSAEWVKQIKGDMAVVLTEFETFWDDMAKVAEANGTTPIGEAFGELLEQIGGGLVETFDEMAIAVSSFATDVADDFARFPQAVLLDLQMLVNDGARLAGDFVQGIIDGIGAKITQAADAAGAMAAAVRDKVKSVLRIGSRSKVLFEIGKFTAQGFEEGVDRGGAPNVLGGGGALRLGRPGGGQITQRNEINIQVSGAGEPDAVARRVGRQMGRALADERRAALAALTQVGG